MTPNPYKYRSDKAKEELIAAQLLSLKNATALAGQEDYQTEIDKLKSVLTLEPECTDPIVFALLGITLASVNLLECTPYLEKALKNNSLHHTLDENNAIMHLAYKYLGLAYLASYKDKLHEIDEPKLAHYYREALRYKEDVKMATFLAKMEVSIERKKRAK